MVLLHMITNTLIRPVWWADVCLLAGKVSEEGLWDRFVVNAFGPVSGVPWHHFWTPSGSFLEHLFPVASPGGFHGPVEENPGFLPGLMPVKGFLPC